MKRRNKIGVKTKLELEITHAIQQRENLHISYLNVEIITTIDYNLSSTHLSGIHNHRRCNCPASKVRATPEALVWYYTQLS